MVDIKKVKTADELNGLLKSKDYLFLAIPVEDKAELYRITHAVEAFICIENILNDYQLRSWIKHGGIDEQLMTKEDPETGEMTLEKPRRMTPVEVIYWMRNRLFEIVDNSNVNLEEGLD